MVKKEGGKRRRVVKKEGGKRRRVAKKELKKVPLHLLRTLPLPQLQAQLQDATQEQEQEHLLFLLLLFFFSTTASSEGLLFQFGESARFGAELWK